MIHTFFRVAWAAFLALGLMAGVLAEETTPTPAPIAPRPQQVDAPLPGDLPGTAESVKPPRKAGPTPKSARHHRARQSAGKHARGSQRIHVSKGAKGRTATSHKSARSGKPAAAGKPHKSVKNKSVKKSR